VIPRNRVVTMQRTVGDMCTRLVARTASQW
jgi:hypothetical protein